MTAAAIVSARINPARTRSMTSRWVRAFAWKYLRELMGTNIKVRPSSIRDRLRTCGRYLAAIGASVMGFRPGARRPPRPLRATRARRLACQLQNGVLDGTGALAVLAPRATTLEKRRHRG